MGLSNPNLPTSIAVTGGFLLLLLLPFEQVLEATGLGDFLSDHLGDTLKNLLIIGFGVLVIKHYGYTEISGLTKFWPQHAYLILVPLYFTLAGPLEYLWLDYQFFHIDPLHVLVLLVSTLSVGLSEEIIFRGFVLPHLIKGTNTRQSLIVPIFISSLLFGVLHLLNLFQAESQLITVLAQVVYATMFGVGFAIMLLRTGSIYPIGFVHGIINFCSSWDKLPGAVEPANIETFKTPEALISVIIVIPFFLYMLLQLKKINCTTL